MFDLESRLRPPDDRRPWPRDFACLCLLVALAAILPISSGDGDTAATGLVGQMATVYLLPAMGFLLALRCGAIDLGVWVNMGLGGVVAAGLINAGVPSAWSLLVGAAAGLGAGVVNAALVARLWLPSPAVTLATAAIIALSARSIVASPTISVSDDAFANWHLKQREGPEKPAANGSSDQGTANSETWRDVPLSATRMLITVIIYGLTMMAMLWLGSHGPAAATAVEGPPPGDASPAKPRVNLAAALCASGMLSAAGGALCLMQSPRAPVPDIAHVIGDLRIPAAAVLAGGLALAGFGRALLACVCLPPAMLLTTNWRLEWPIFWSSACPVEFQYVALVAMAVVAHEAGRRAMVPLVHPAPRDSRVWKFLAPRRLLAATVAIIAADILLSCARAFVTVPADDPVAAIVVVAILIGQVVLRIAAAVSLAMLGVTAVLAHERRERAEALRAIATGAMGLAAILIMAAAGRVDDRPGDWRIRDGLRIASAVLWLAATAGLIAGRLIERARCAGPGNGE